MKIPILVVCGPTASGKTGLAVELALRRNGEVVSADSMQIYCHMDIGTAKPTAGERRGVPHHLMGFLERSERFSVADYVAVAGEAIRDIHNRGRLPIVAGGTGLYISSLVDNIAFQELEGDPAIRAELEAVARERGNEALWTMLRDCDPVLAERLHPNNRGRVIRAIEVTKLTGVPMSEHQRRARETESPYKATILGLTCSDRTLLYERIDRRVDQMLANGLVEEAKALLERFSLTAGQAIGYKELVPYFEGKITLEEAAGDIKRETRRYAKRQLTWFRRDERVRWINVDQFDSVMELADEAERLLREEGQ